MQNLGRQHAFVGGHVVGRLALGTAVRGGVDTPRQRRDDGRGHFVLDGEDVIELAVVALGPDVRVGFGVDQLHGDADAIARLAHAALDDILHLELARDLAHIDGLCPCT